MRAEERKEQIIENAKKLFSEKGYHQTQISDIVKKSGIARGTIYQYFKNKDDIFITILERFYKLWTRSLSGRRESVDLKSVEPVEYFRQSIEATLTILAEDEDYCNIMLRVGLGLGGQFESLIGKFESKMIKAVSADLRLGIRNGHVRDDINTELMSNIMAGALLRISYYYFAKKKSLSKNQIIKMTDEFVNTFINGIFIT